MAGDEAHEAMRALAGAVCPECGLGFDDVKRFADPDAPDTNTFSPNFGGQLRQSRAKLLITVHPCGCRISVAQYADLKRRLKR